MGKQTKIENVKIQIVVDGTDRSFEIKGLSEKAVEPVQKFWTTDRVELGRKMFIGYLEVGNVLIKIRNGMRGASTKSIGEAFGKIFPNVDASDANLRSKCIKLAELAGTPKLGFMEWKAANCPALNAPAAVLDRWAKKDDKPATTPPDKTDKGAETSTTSDKTDKGAETSTTSDAAPKSSEVEAFPTSEKLSRLLEMANALLSDYNSGKLGPEDLSVLQGAFKVLGKVIKGLEAEEELLRKARKAA